MRQISLNSAAIGPPPIRESEMFRMFKEAAARLANLFARKARPSAEWRRVYGDGAPAFSIE